MRATENDDSENDFSDSGSEFNPSEEESSESENENASNEENEKSDSLDDGIMISKVKNLNIVPMVRVFENL